MPGKHANELVGFRPPAVIRNRIKISAELLGQTVSEFLTDAAIAACDAAAELAAAELAAAGLPWCQKHRRRHRCEPLD